jgi:hypothetical protein
MSYLQLPLSRYGRIPSDAVARRYKAATGVASLGKNKKFLRVLL